MCFVVSSGDVAICACFQCMWVHSSVVRAADRRSAGPWLKSGCALGSDLDVQNPIGVGGRVPAASPRSSPILPLGETRAGLTPQRTEETSVESGHLHPQLAPCASEGRPRGCVCRERTWCSGTTSAVSDGPRFKSKVVQARTTLLASNE